jgi:hypothetical protein
MIATRPPIIRVKAKRGYKLSGMGLDTGVNAMAEDTMGGVAKLNHPSPLWFRGARLPTWISLWRMARLPMKLSMPLFSSLR